MSLGTQFALVLLSSRQDFEETHGALKLTWFTSLDRVETLKLEGALVDGWVEELGNACAGTIAANCRIRLDLAAVTFVDAAGLQLLNDLLDQGAEVAACSAFVAELLHHHRGEDPLSSGGRP